MKADLNKRMITLGVVLLLALLFLYPTAYSAYQKLNGKSVTKESFKNWISKPISLGLDLSGGVHLLYKVNAAEAVESRLQSELSSLRSELRKQKIYVTKAVISKDSKIELTLYSERSEGKVKDLVRQDFTALELLDTRKGSGDKVTLVYGKGPLEQQAIERAAIGQAVETLRARVDQFGVSEPVIQKVGAERIVLQMPGAKDVESVKKIVGRVAKLEFRLVAKPGAPEDETKAFKRKADGSVIKLERDVPLTGAAVTDARTTFDQYGRPEVSLTLTSDGGKTFGRITGENVGRQLAIVLDGLVYSDPRINERIGGGRCVINGVEHQEASELSMVLRAGALPASLDVIEERTVGPSLGAESIRKGIIAIVAGFVLILGFMLFYYKKAGAVASGILGLNIFLVLAGLSAFGATLTLPGLAGLALTVGMAVDANVIIFERIREELRNGAGRDPAVAAGFEKAFSAIFDSNLTTFISAVILYTFGSGPIRGFALTLGVGIVTTIFCATFVSRLAFDYFELKGKPTLSI